MLRELELRSVMDESASTNTNAEQRLENIQVVQHNNIFCYEKLPHCCQATKLWTSRASVGPHIIYQHKSSWYSNIMLMFYLYFSSVDYYTHASSVTLLPLTLLLQLKLVFHTIPVTEVNSFQSKEAKNTWLACVQWAMNNVVSLIWND